MLVEKCFFKSKLKFGWYKQEFSDDSCIIYMNELYVNRHKLLENIWLQKFIMTIFI